MKVIKFFCKAIVTIVALIMILALILVIASLFLTPARLGLEDLEIGGVTLEKQGLADTSFYHIGKIAVGILDTPDHESVEEHVYEETIDKLPEISTQAPSGETSEGEPDKESKSDSLESLVKEPIYFEEEVEVEMDSSELSAILNMVIGSKSIEDLGGLNGYFAGNTQNIYFAFNGEESEDLDVKINLADTEEYFDVSKELMLEMLQEYKGEFVSVNPTADDEFVYLETVVKLYLPEDIVSQINDMKVITITDCVFVTLESKYTLEDGKLIPVKTDESSIAVNKLSKEHTVKIATSLMSIVSGETVDGESQLAIYNNTASELLGEIFNNLAVVEKVENNQIVFKTRTK